MNPDAIFGGEKFFSEGDMNRRGFLGGILALGAAPAIVRADALMKVVPRDLPFELSFTTADMVMPPGGNTILTMEEITREALRVFNHHIGLMKSIDPDFAQQWGGTTVKIRRPPSYRRLQA